MNSRTTLQRLQSLQTVKNVVEEATGHAQFYDTTALTIGFNPSMQAETSHPRTKLTNAENILH